MDNITRKKADEFNKVEYFGVLNQYEINQRYQKADFLINISNTVAESVPSKIFELFSTGRSIINLIENETDFSISYFE